MEFILPPPIFPDNNPYADLMQTPNFKLRTANPIVGTCEDANESV